MPHNHQGAFRPTRPSFYRLTLLLLAGLTSALGAPACADDAEVDAEAEALCAQYDTLNSSCGYDKFTDTDHCEASWSQCDDAAQAQAKVFYDCLGQCTDGSTGIEDISAACSTMAFGDTPPACAE